MSLFILEHHNRAELADRLTADKWIVACLCAAWCDVCSSYRQGFESMAARHPDKEFLWIDVEDHADLVGDFEIENFPTLLLEQADNIVFYGAMVPNAQIAERLLLNHVARGGSGPAGPGNPALLDLGAGLRRRIQDTQQADDQ
jgi:thioredoxin 1